MRILVLCWRYESYLGAPSELAGTQVKCVTCGSTVSLPIRPPTPLARPTFWESRVRPALVGVVVLLWVGVMMTVGPITLRRRIEDLRARGGNRPAAWWAPRQDEAK